MRHHDPSVPLSVVIRTQDNELLARQAGANNVLNPVSFTGLLLAGSAQGAHVADYIADLASVGGGIQLRERPVPREAVGRSLHRRDRVGRGVGHSTNGNASVRDRGGPYG